MKTFTVYPTSINPRAIDEAVKALEDGEIIIYPTDSLYALGCDAMNQKAVERLCRLKGIDPKRNTLSIACADISQAAGYARIDNRAFEILKRTLPAPITYILPASSELPKVFKGRKEVGIRIPDNPIAIAIIRALGHPVCTTSVAAAPADEGAHDPDVLAEAFEPIASVLIDGGPSSGEGTSIIDITDPLCPQTLRD